MLTDLATLAEVLIEASYAEALEALAARLVALKTDADELLDQVGPTRNLAWLTLPERLGTWK
jgi:hypothetical protein